MFYIYVLSFFLFLASCSSEFEPRKAVINFEVPHGEFDEITLMLKQIAEEKSMNLKDNSYKFGTEKSPQARLTTHLKSSNNLDIYTDCYSDWEKCSVEFLCHTACPNWHETVDLFEHNISKKWAITNNYRNKSRTGITSNDS